MRIGNRQSLARNYAELGVSYVWVLLTAALLAVASALAGTVYSLEIKQEREAELLRIGREFRAALSSYYESSPGVKRFPATFDDLIRDPRFPGMRRHLRRLYADPMTGKPEWGEVRVGGQIVGVHSLSDVSPLKVGNFEPEDATFEGKTQYSQWVFMSAAGNQATVAGRQPRH